MLEKKQIVDRVRTIIDSNQQLFKKFSRIYVFGSYLDRGSYAHDLDVLLLYNVYSAEILEAVEIIPTVLEREFNLPIDLTVLSMSEEANTGFLLRIKNRSIRIR